MLCFNRFVTVIRDTVSDEGSRQKRVRIQQDQWMWAVPTEGEQGDNPADGDRGDAHEELEDAAQIFEPATSLQSSETDESPQVFQMRALVEATAAAAEENIDHLSIFRACPSRHDSPATKRQRLVYHDDHAEALSAKSIVRIRPGLRHNLLSSIEPPSVYVLQLVCCIFIRPLLNDDVLFICEQ